MTSHAEAELQGRFALAQKMAIEAGAVALAHFNARERLVIETKADPQDVVSIADREVEELIRARIAAAFPGDAVLGEEYGVSAGTSEFTWVIDPIDGTDPVENARIIISELEKYSQDLAAKPRWLVFNKIDLLDKAEAEEKAKAIAEALGWEDKYYLISAASGLGVKDLCWDVMTFIIENPVVQAEEAKQPEKVEFMWDDYHRQQLEEIAEEDDEDWDDDWDEDDEEGVEFIYKR